MREKYVREEVRWTILCRDLVDGLGGCRLETQPRLVWVLAGSTVGHHRRIRSKISELIRIDISSRLRTGKYQNAYLSSTVPTPEIH